MSIHVCPEAIIGIFNQIDPSMMVMVDPRTGSSWKGSNNQTNQDISNHPRCQSPESKIKGWTVAQNRTYRKITVDNEE